MNEKHNGRLELIGRIDEEIIDRTTEKRMRLLGGRIARRRMLTVLVAAALCVCLVGGTVVGLLVTRKQAPVYLGMTVSSEAPRESAAIDYSPDSLTLSATPMHEHGGPHKPIGDVVGDKYKDDKPETDETEDPGTLEVGGAAESIYYAQPGEDVYITIRLSNPDDYVIQSFTLNGKTYASYMFERGSDMENLILKYNVGDAEGIVEYTLDEILYIDDEEAIKRVSLEGDRTVSVGVYTERQPKARVESSVAGIDRLSLTVSVTDELSLVEDSGGYLRAVLLLGDAVVAEKPIALGESSVVFDGLTRATEYRYAIVASYDALDGKGFAPHLLASGEAKTKRTLAFDSIGSTQTSISFSLVWDESHPTKKLDSLSLWLGEEKISDLAIDATSVDGLLTDTEYKLVATYIYNGADETVEQTIKTEARALPDFSVTADSDSFDSAEAEYSFTDTDGVLLSHKLELYLGYTLVASGSAQKIAATGLYSGTEYVARVTYTYDLGNGVGVQTGTTEETVRTLARAIPSVTLSGEALGYDGARGEYSFVDTDRVMLSHKIELYLGDTLVASGKNETLSTGGLKSYTDYRIVVTYTYDLGNGAGVQTGTTEKTVRTAPYVNVTDFTIANTSAVFEGDTVYLRAMLDNPNGATVTGVTVNGKECALAAGSDGERLFVEFIIGDGVGGEVSFSIDAVTVSLGEESYTLTPESRPVKKIFVNGTIKVLSFEYVNKSLEPVDWYFPDESRYLMIKLSNPTGYKLDSVTLEGKGRFTGLKRVDDDTWYFENNSVTEPDLASIAYSNQYVNNTLDVGIMSARCYRLDSSEKKYISTAEDLLSMNGSCYYELTCDIDLAGREWRGGDLEGVFNGAGHTIKNMSFVGSASNTNLSLGLFGHAGGVVYDLHFAGVNFVVDLRSSGGEYSLNFGCLAGESHATVRGCSVSSDSFVSLKNPGGVIAAGGIVGKSYTGRLYDCESRATISVDSTECGATVGGIAGELAEGVIARCANYGEIRMPTLTWKHNAYAGGISGGANGSAVSDCVNYGKVTGNCYVAGIVASCGELYRCANFGEITATRYWAGGISAEMTKVCDCLNAGVVKNTASENGYIGYDPIAFGGEGGENSYTLYKYSRKDPICTVEDLNSSRFYTEQLGWSEEVWDLSSLDFESGRYPRLK